MDTKTKLVNSITRLLYGTLSEKQLSAVENAVYTGLDGYDVIEHCTALVPRSNNAMNALQKFAVAKHLQGLSVRSVQRYYNMCYPLLDTLGKALEDISTVDIRSYLLNYKAQRDVSNRTLDGMRRCFSAFFSWCFTEGLIQDNPCTAVQQIKYEKTVQFPFSDTELEKIKRACKTKRDRALVEFFYSTGCRVTETSLLNRTDIDFQKHTVRVMGKGGKERIVYLTDVALLYLTEYLESRSDTLPALFIGMRGDRLTKSGMEAALRRIGETAHVDNVHPHRYRRTLATNMLDRGASIQDVATILGHEDVNTTKIYCYITQENIATTHKRYIS